MKKFDIEHKIDLTTGKTTVKAPWGEGDITDPLDAIRHVLKQLLFFQKTNKSMFLRRDILGYQLIILTGIPDNAAEFMRLKDLERRGKLDIEFSDNLAVINHMKANGLWKEKQ